MGNNGKKIPGLKTTREQSKSNSDFRADSGATKDLNNLPVLKFAKPIEPEQREILKEQRRRAPLSTIARKHKSLGSTLREIGNYEDVETGYTMQFAMCYNAYLAAVGGDKDARSWISDRTEGKAVQRKIIQNIDVITKVIGVIERVISDPLPKGDGGAAILKRQLAYEFEKLANEGSGMLGEI